MKRLIVAGVASVCVPFAIHIAFADGSSSGVGTGASVGIGSSRSIGTSKSMSISRGSTRIAHMNASNLILEGMGTTDQIKRYGLTDTNTSLGKIACGGLGGLDGRHPSMKSQSMMMFTAIGSATAMANTVIRKVKKEPEDGITVASLKAAWHDITLGETKSLCEAYLIRRYVTGNELGWPRNVDPIFGQRITNKTVGYVNTMTRINLYAYREARRIANELGPVAYKSPRVVMHVARELAIKDADKMWDEWTSTLPITRAVLNMTGSCGQGWTVTIRGETYGFCGTQEGWTIRKNGSPWAGDGWLGGVQTTVDISDSGAATIEQALGDMTSAKTDATKSASGAVGLAP